MPKNLHNKLNGRQQSLPAPNYVAMGSQDRYYISFTNGAREWVGCDEMTKELESSARSVMTVAFGEHWDSHFIVYTDGYWNYNNLPHGLSHLLKSRKHKADMSCVSLGPNGEYYALVQRMAVCGGVVWRTIQTLH